MLLVDLKTGKVSKKIQKEFGLFQNLKFPNLFVNVNREKIIVLKTVCRTVYKTVHRKAIAINKQICQSHDNYWPSDVTSEMQKLKLYSMSKYKLENKRKHFWDQTRQIYFSKEEHQYYVTKILNTSAWQSWQGNTIRALTFADKPISSILIWNFWRSKHRALSIGTFRTLSNN